MVSVVIKSKKLRVGERVNQAEETGQPEEVEIIEKKFQRIVTITGGSEYRIDGGVVSFGEYNAELERQGVMVKARNFLVFQGDVESIASQSPMELTRLVERVSGSAEYREQYEELRRQEEAAAEQSNLLFSKRRALASELKSLMEMKKEQEEYESKRQEISRMETEYMRLLIHQGEQKEVSLIQEIDDDTNAIQSKEREMEQKEQELNGYKRESAKAYKQMIKDDKTVRMVERQIEEQQPVLVGLREAVITTKRKLKDQENKQREIERDLQRKESGLQELVQEISELERVKQRSEQEREQQERENEKEREGKTGKERDEMRTKYYQIKAEIETKYSKQNLELQTLQKQVSKLAKQSEQVNQQIQDLTQQIQQKQQQVDSQNEQIDGDIQTVQQLEQKYKELELQRKKNEREHERLEVLEQEASEKLGKVLEQIVETKRKMADNRQEAKRAEMIAGLRRLFHQNNNGANNAGGRLVVHGRVADICAPIQSKYDEAVRVVLGRNSDAIVVDTQQTAIECIRYLREQRAGRATFLPLDIMSNASASTASMDIDDDGGVGMGMDMDVDVDFGLQGIRIKRATQVIRYDMVYDQVMKYVCANTVVCENIQQAKQFQRSSRRNTKVKVVTLDGTVIERNGNISGGYSASQAHGTSDMASDAKRLNKLIQTREELAAQINQTSQRKAKLLLLLQQSSPSASAPGTMPSTTDDTLQRLEMARDILSGSKRRLQTLLSEKQQLQHKHDILASSLPSQQENIDLELKIEELKSVVNKPFVAFCQKYNFDSIESYEDAVINATKLQQQQHANIARISSQIDKLQTQRSFEDDLKSQMSDQLNVLNAQIQATKDQIEQFTARADELETNTLQNNLLVQLNDSKAKYKTARQTYAELQQKILELTQNISGLLAESIRDGKRLVGNKSAQLERLRLEKYRLLVKAKYEGMEGIQLSFSASEGSSKGKKGAEAGVVKSLKDVDVDSLKRMVLNNQSQEHQQISVVLSAKTKGRLASDNAEATLREMIEQLEVQIAQYRKMLQSSVGAGGSVNVAQATATTGVNLGHLEAKTKVLSTKLSAIDHEFTKIRNHAKSASSAFLQIKRKRTELFLDMYNYLAQHIDAFYKQLTIVPNLFPMGGTAYLTLETPTASANTGGSGANSATASGAGVEPYCGGIKYHVMPPLKRFRDIESLSGGEKTIAALALVFTIQSYRTKLLPATSSTTIDGDGSRFYVLDEVDAALDTNNLNMLARYISNSSSVPPSVGSPINQFIVISLKQKLYEKSKSLLGVYKHNTFSDSSTIPSNTESRILSLNLS